MSRRGTLAGIAVVVSLLVLAGCAKKEETSALYVLEELEAASAVKKPRDRITRLAVFIRNHPAHPYRSLAYQRVLDALYDDMKDAGGATRYLADALARETDVSVRGDLLYAKFSRLYRAEKTRALAFVDSLLAVERSPRLFLYLGYDLMENKEDAGLVEKCFVKSADLYPAPILRAHALAMAGSFLESIGQKEEAKGYLVTAQGNPEADMTMGKLFWDEGKREEALDAYIRAVARMPGARGRVHLDSLYAIVYPGAKDLGEKILALRIVDEGPFPDALFADLDGKLYDLSKTGGEKTVINALSPT